MRWGFLVQSEYIHFMNKNYQIGKFNIKNWAEDDRPREKMLLKGGSALTDAELLAILIGSGSKFETAVDLSKRILASFDNNLVDLGKVVSRI